MCISMLAASTHDQEVFSFYSDERFCNGFEEVLGRYKELVPHLRLAGCSLPVCYVMSYFSIVVIFYLLYFHYSSLGQDLHLLHLSLKWLSQLLSKAAASTMYW